MDGAIADLVGGLYEVAVAPGLWQRWLGSLCDALETQAGVLIIRFEPGVGDQGIFAVGIPELTEEGASGPSPPASRPAAPAPYLGYLAEDARLFSKALVLAPGELLILSELLSHDEFVATRFYREWMRPRDLHHLVSMIVSRTPKHTTGLSLLRRPERPRFAQEELDVLQQLLPHLQRVVQIQEMLLEAEREHEMAEQVLEAERCGAIRLDATGRVCHTNRRAAALLERGEGLGLERGQLRAQDPRETPALRNLVRRATACGGSRSAGVLAVSRAAPRHALVVSVSPLRPDAPRVPWLSGSGALVLLSDPDELPALCEAALRQLYGLTEAEAHVAARLVRGEGVAEIAAVLRVRPATILTHLQQALAKTGTRRQADLVRLLLMGTAALAELECVALPAAS